MLTSVVITLSIMLTIVTLAAIVGREYKVRNGNVLWEQIITNSIIGGGLLFMGYLAVVSFIVHYPAIFTAIVACAVLATAVFVITSGKTSQLKKLIKKFTTSINR